MNYNNDMIKLVKLLEGKDQTFAGEEVGQKPGDQVRGTDKAETKGTDHPFKGRLVGEDTTLEDVLAKKYADFKELQAKEKAEAEAKDEDDKEDTKEELDEEPQFTSLEDQIWYKDGQPYILKRKGSAFYLFNKAGQAVLNLPIPPKYIPYNLEELGYKISKTAAMYYKDPNWFQNGAQAAATAESTIEEDNPVDTVTVDVPLMIRLLEYAREDAQTDMDLHNVAERLIKLSSEGRTLSMQDYDKIVVQQNESQINELGADGSALGSVAAARSQQAALTTKPSPVNPNGDKDQASATTQQGTSPTVKPAAPVTGAKPTELDPDEQDALDKIKANAGLKSQFDRLIQQAKSTGV